MFLHHILVVQPSGHYGMNMNIARKVIFEGRVQGVGFRYTTKELALGYDILGWVKNSADGTVELQLSGAEDEVNEYLHELIEESNVAHHIKKKHISEIPLDPSFSGFTIK